VLHGSVINAWPGIKFRLADHKSTPANSFTVLKQTTLLQYVGGLQDRLSSTCAADSLLRSDEGVESLQCLTGCLAKLVPNMHTMIAYRTMQWLCHSFQSRAFLLGCGVAASAIQYLFATV
jgi:hypothetical protein